LRHEAALAPRGYTRDEGRTLRAALQEEALNHLKLLEVERPQVVSVEEKAWPRPCQVRFRETSAS
jgi:hypothetical protein